MAQVPDINKVQSGQQQGAGIKGSDQKQAQIDQSRQKESASQRIQELRGQTGSAPASSTLKSLIQYLEGILGQKAPDGDDHQKLEFLTMKIKEKPPQEQIDLLKQVSTQFPSKKGSELENKVKGLIKDVLGTLKETAKTDKATANTLAVNKETLGAIYVDENNSGLDKVSDGNKFVSVQNDDIRGVGKKPLEKSLGFMLNFADHQQGFFEDSAFKFSEFAAGSDKSKAAYKLMRQADKFWQGERTFLKDLKQAGKSRDNSTELQAALVELATLQVQRGSSFDQDFANIEAGTNKKTDTADLESSISEKKSEIKTLHSNLA